MKEFVLIHQGHRRRLAVPSEQAEPQREAFELLPTFTKAGRVWKFAVETLVRSGMGLGFFERVNDQFLLTEHIRCSDWVSTVGALLESKIESVVFVFPYDTERSKFSSILYLDTSQKLFVKFAWNEPERMELVTERRALETLRSSRFDNVRFPALVRSESVLGGILNVYNFEHRPSTPCRVWGASSEGAWREIVNHTRAVVPVSQLDWIRSCRRLEWWPTDLLKNEKMEIVVSAAHGDYAPWNLRICNDGSVFLHDWEQYEPTAPYLLDPVHFVLQDLVLVRRWSPSKVARRLKELLISVSNSNNVTLDLMLALGFLRVHKSSVRTEVLDAISVSLLDELS